MCYGGEWRLHRRVRQFMRRDGKADVKFYKHQKGWLESTGLVLAYFLCPFVSYPTDPLSSLMAVK